MHAQHKNTENFGNAGLSYCCIHVLSDTRSACSLSFSSISKMHRKIVKTQAENKYTEKHGDTGLPESDVFMFRQQAVVFALCPYAHRA